LKLLVTGASGFLAKAVASAAAARGWMVAGTSRRTLPTFSGEVSHPSALASLIGRFAPDAVFHGAGPADVSRSVVAPREDFLANLQPLLELLETLRLAKSRARVVLPSSAAVHGDPATLPITESSPVAPLSPYGFHKVAAELLLREYRELHGLETRTLRVFSVFGVAQERQLLRDLFLRARDLRGETLLLDGTGNEARDYLPVAEVSEIVLALLDAWPPATVINACSGIEVPIRRVAGTVLRALGLPEKIAFSGRNRPGHPSRWRGSTELLATIRRRAWTDEEILERMAETVRAWASS
jgi:nucleoside-diphosphate-sugar epimerase